MTNEQIKEELSNRFIGILAANKGFTLDKPERDIGVDYILRKPTTYTTPNGKTRYTYDGRFIDLQLKSTTENSIIDNGQFIKFDLEAKTYNDLVVRQANGVAPLVLILFVLPIDPNTWVEIDPSEIKLRKHAYWFIPPIGSEQTNNEHSIRIEISKGNMLGIDCFDNIHNLLLS